MLVIQVSHPSKMIKAACYQLMRSLTIGVSLNADKMQPSAVNSSTSILRQVLQLGCQATNCATPEHLLLAKDQHRGWASLGFIRAVSLKSGYCRSMCSTAWIQLLFTLVEGTETSLDCSLPTQVNQFEDCWSLY